MEAPRAMSIHEAKVVIHDAVTPRMRRLVMQAPDLAAALTSGQFMTIQVAGEPKQLARVPLSFAVADAAAGTVETIYLVQGPGTRALAGYEVGKTLSVLGPLGHGWRFEEAGGHTVLVAGGVGITPILSAAAELARAGKSFEAILGARTAEELWGADQLAALGATAVSTCTDDGTAGTHGLVTDVLAPLLEAGTADLVMACGPEPMLKAVAGLCGATTPCQVSMERAMTCGFGACNTCAVPTTHGIVATCLHGPVLDASEVIWQ